MATVVSRIKQIKQPYGGYVPLTMFEEIKFDDEIILNDNETIHASIVGMAVDYLTRFIINNNAEEAFHISIIGAKSKDKIMGSNGKCLKEAYKSLKKVCGLDDESITNAVKLAKFDIWHRNPFAALQTNDTNEPSSETIENIRILVNRTINALKKFGTITKYGFTFEPPNKESLQEDFLKILRIKPFGGYTRTVSTGDGDYLTQDTLWDLKVSKTKPRSNDTLQILMYWIMGQHSGQDIFKDITKIGLFNPRLNTVYHLEVSKIPKKVIEAVEKDVICY